MQEVVFGVNSCDHGSTGNIQPIDAAATVTGSQVKQEDPLNLSILISGGKETN